jgi:hypothetical protein
MIWTKELSTKSESVMKGYMEITSALVAKWVARILLNVTLYGWNGKHSPTQVQGWTFKMKVHQKLHWDLKART